MNYGPEATEPLQTADYDAADHTPTPSLTYSGWASRDWRPDMEGVVCEPGEPPLDSIQEVTVWSHGELRVALRGPLRKRDGTRGRHSRGAFVDLGQQQPDWLASLIRDARRRLCPIPPAVGA